MKRITPELLVNNFMVSEPSIPKSSIRNRIGEHIYKSSLPIHTQPSPQLSPTTAFLRELELQKQNNPQNNKSQLFIRVNDGKNIRNLTHSIFNPHHLTEKATRRRKSREDRGYSSLGGRKIRRTRRRKRKN
jgi:hypothetical protein